MVFSSIPFLYFFLPLCLVLYYAVPGRWKNTVLLIFSLIFYAWGEPVYILLMLASCTVNWLLCLLIDRPGAKYRRLWLVCAVILNLAALMFFKYANLLTGAVNSIAGTSIPALSLALPIGISFYTFQAMSCVIDVYRREIRADRSLPDFITYISMFPQLIAGPIVRYSDIAAELKSPRTCDFTGGTLRFAQGLFKKVLLANTLGQLWEASKLPTSTAAAWLGVCAFTLQIYFDFSGYSDMAIGMGKMLGFHFPENFNYPYIARSVTEFWRRWHITLTTWFRAYVYIPLGGNRVKVWKHIRNILIVWALSGFWHGAAWNFLLWGLYYGLLLIGEKYLWGNALERCPSWVRRFYTLFIVVVGFTIFVFDDFSALGTQLAAMFFLTGVPFDTGFLYLIRSYGIVFLAGCVFSAPICRAAGEKLAALPNPALRTVYGVVRVCVYVLLFLLSTACLVRNSYNPFLYFRF